MKWLSAIAVCLVFCSPVCAKQTPQIYTIPIPSAPNFQNLDWLIGKWSGKTTGAKPAGSVNLSVSYDLDKRLMLLHESVSLPATKLAPATRESFLGILSTGRTSGELALDLYSSSGFVTHYQVAVKTGEIDFNPDGGRLAPSGWLFRRTLKRGASGGCTEIVNVAPPGEAFFNYYTADLHQVAANGTATPAAAVPKTDPQEQPKSSPDPPKGFRRKARRLIEAISAAGR